MGQQTNSKPPTHICQQSLTALPSNSIQKLDTPLRVVLPLTPATVISAGVTRSPPRDLLSSSLVSPGSTKSSQVILLKCACSCHTSAQSPSGSPQLLCVINPRRSFRNNTSLSLANSSWIITHCYQSHEL